MKQGADGVPVAEIWRPGLRRLDRLGVPLPLPGHSPAVTPGTLAVAVAISQSGETADTMASLTWCKVQGLQTACVVNVYSSSMAREAGVLWPNHAGPEIGVASTKAFIAPEAALLSLALALAVAVAVATGVARGSIDSAAAGELARARFESTPELPGPDDGAAQKQLATAC